MQVSNVAMITNVELVPKQPTTFSELTAMAAKLKKSGKGKKGFAVGQGPNSDGYSLYPLFSGLGGFFFGKDADGNWDPSVVGLSDPTFLKNSKQIDQWNASGLINSAMTADDARKAFANGKAPFWMAGPEDMATLKGLTFVYRITSVPAPVSGVKASPLLRVQGFNITSYAYQHGALGDRPQAGHGVLGGRGPAAGPRRRVRPHPGEHRRGEAGRRAATAGHRPGWR